MNEAPLSHRWTGEPERLDRVLPALSLARSRSQAADLISSGVVQLNGVPVTKAGQRVATASTVTLSRVDPYVSRGAHKLIAALDAFDVDPSAKIVLDLGASTGGFTQVLLERDARTVLALDVGHGQMDPTVADDPRVICVEGTNARDLDPESLAAATGVEASPELVVADLSFISLTLILPAIALTSPRAELILLIKPQFEVGRAGVRDGIVTDPSLRVGAVHRVLAAAADAGYATAALIRSPIAGGHGNLEFLVHFVPASRADRTQWRGDIEALCADDDPVSRPRETGPPQSRGGQYAG